MRWGGFLLLLCPLFANAQEPIWLPIAPPLLNQTPPPLPAPPAPKLTPPTVAVEVEPTAFFPRPRPAPVPVPNCPCPTPTTPGTPPSTPGTPPATPGTPPKLPTPEDMARQVPNANNANSFAQGTEGGGTSARTFNDNFNGDFGGITVTERRQIGTVTQTFFNPSTEGTITVTSPVYQTFTTVLTNRYNGILITDNDSPRPTDRAYFGYNYYNGINPSLNSGQDRIDMHRQTAGFEKTFLNGDASFGMRLPFVQTYGPRASSISPFDSSITAGPQLTQRNAGDLSLLFKYAFMNDRATGDLMSIGLVVTTPTGGGNSDVQLADGSSVPSSVLLQPWLGGVKMFQWGYTQAISSFIIPTSTQEPTMANNSVAVGYYLYNNATDRFINAIVPVIEAHVRTPLTFRDPNGVVYVQDQCNLTFGVHFRTMNATISPAFTIPTVGPNPFNYEGAIWVNFRF